jgi:hypothetical protein
LRDGPGKSLFLHEDFGSRRIDFSSNLGRDERIHLVTGNACGRIRATSESEGPDPIDWCVAELLAIREVPQPLEALRPDGTDCFDGR